MANFPQDYLAAAPALVRSANLLGDDGSKNGVYTIAQVLSLLNLADFYPKLLTADDVINEIAADVTDYTLLLTGTTAAKNKYNKFLCSAACFVRLPAGVPAGATFPWYQYGAGKLSFVTVAGANQVIRSTSGTRSAYQHAEGFVKSLGNNEWKLSGELMV